VHITTLEFFNVKFYLTLCTYMGTLFILYICREILPPLDDATIEFHWIMVSKIEDASLPNQVPKDETIDRFHNITQLYELIVLSFIISTSWIYVEFNIYERCSIRQCLWKKMVIILNSIIYYSWDQKQSCNQWI
jgi:hypothetical protein